MRRRSGYGWFELIAGILMVLFGVYTFANPGRTLTVIVVIYGLIAVVTGISDIVFYARSERFTGFGPVVSLATGILSVMAGIMLLTYPNAGRWIMVMLLPIWFIAHGVSRLSNLRLIRVCAGSFHYYLTLTVNGIGIVLGCMMIVWPMLSLFSAGFLIGTYLVLLGVDRIAVAVSAFGSR